MDRAMNAAANVFGPAGARPFAMSLPGPRSVTQTPRSEAVRRAAPASVTSVSGRPDHCVPSMRWRRRRRRRRWQTRPGEIAAGRRVQVEHFTGDEDPGSLRNMKRPSISANDTPPAVEIARAIAATPVRRTGTALTRRAMSGGARPPSRTPSRAAASRTRSIAAAESSAILFVHGHLSI